MTDYSEWEAANSAYLADALEWLRRRLARLVPEGAPTERRAAILRRLALSDAN